MLAAALNNHDQVVGNGFLYSNGSIQSLLSLLPASSGWSKLNATGINDAGQIVRQGMYNGQELASMMTPDSNEVPRPSTFAIWAVITSGMGWSTSSSGAAESRPAALADPGVAKPCPCNSGSSAHDRNR